MFLHIDFETRSAVELEDVGMDVYAKHPTTDVWCVGYAIDNGHAQLWPLDFPVVLHPGTIVVAHNAAFELAIWNHIMVPRYGWPDLQASIVRCTMAQAYAMGLPGSLERAAAAVGIRQQKDLAGQRLMLQMCRPRAVKDGVYEWWSDPEKLRGLGEYCLQDVRVEQELHARLLALSDAEQELWEIDHAINSRGVYLDLPAINAAVEIVAGEQIYFEKAIRDVTDGAVGSPSEVAALTRWINNRGVDCAGIAKQDVVNLLAEDALPTDVRRALEIRQEAAKTSTAKLIRMRDSVSDDGRIRYILQFHAAATGRWGGRRIQPQNLPRPKLSQADTEAALDIISDHRLSPKDKTARLDYFYGNPMNVVSDCLRGIICAAPGYELLAADFSNIEGRVVAWLAGEEWKLEAFRAQDAKCGPEIYSLTAGKIYHRDPSTITKKDPERQIGKVAELALGYQGGVGAFKAMARTYGVEVGDIEAEVIKSEWRNAHPKIQQYWWDLEEAAYWAVYNPGCIYSAGQTPRKVKFRVKGSFLFCQLPNGRILTYPYPKLKLKMTPWGEDKEQVHYMHVDGLTNKWVETNTYGGKLCENITQAVSRDILAEAIKRVHANKLSIVLHVHDEIIIEEREGTCELKKFEQLVAALPRWATDLPITVEGWCGRRYRK